MRTVQEYRTAITVSVPVMFHSTLRHNKEKNKGKERLTGNLHLGSVPL